MRKLSKLFLMGAIALGLVACNNEDVPDNSSKKEGNTHVSVALNLKGAGLRALPNDYNDVGEWAGNDVVKTVTVYVSDATEVERYDFEVGEVGDNKDYEKIGTLLRPTTAAAIKTTAGLKKVYVLVNGKADVFTHLGIVTNGTGASGAFEAAYATLPLVLTNSTDPDVEMSASKLADIESDEDYITMTNVEPQTINVAPNVKQDETITDAKNRVSIQVERAVARVMVTKSADTYTVPSALGGSPIGTLTNITWVIAQGENSLFVQRNSTWNTPNFGWKPASDADYWDNADDKYDYSGLSEEYDAANWTGGSIVPELSAYAKLNAAGDNKAAVLASLGLDENAEDGKFLLPNTHAYGAPGEAYAGGYAKGNTAYVLVRAQFTPAADQFADGEVYTPGADFYVGANGKFYTSANNAVTPAIGGVAGQTVARYVNGKVLYYAWLNPDVIPGWYNSPVLRNNIYHIHITGFRTLGVNWNPLFPEDPNKPWDPNDPDDPNKPKNPDPKPWVDPDCEDCGEEPENPIDPKDPLTTPETWMSVDVTVLPWLVHSYSVDLGI